MPLLRNTPAEAIRRDFGRYRSEGVRLAAHVLLVCPGFRASRVQRQMHTLQAKQWPRPVRLLVNQIAHGLSEWTGLRTRIILPAQAVIGPGLYIPHFGPVTVNPDVRMGENCTLHQGVTLGQAGRGERRGAPTLGDRVYVGVNAVVIGRISIGDDAVIGAGAVVTKSVPPRAVVVGNPARVVSLAGSFDLVHYPGMEEDPARLVSLAARSLQDAFEDAADSLPLQALSGGGAWCAVEDAGSFPQNLRDRK